MSGGLAQSATRTKSDARRALDLDAARRLWSRLSLISWRATAEVTKQAGLKAFFYWDGLTGKQAADLRARLFARIREELAR